MSTSSSKRVRPQSQTQSLSSSSSLPLPRFLTHPVPTLYQKFKSINAHETLFRQTTTAATPLHLEEADARNRYADILPWAHNTVQLRTLEDPYINASPVDLGRPGERFIATQGPLREEEAHFWEMVWQEGCEVVVMLTQVWEEGREKCSVYYPKTEGEVKILEGWGRVECVRVSEEERTEVRELRVWKGEVEGSEGEDGVEERGEGRTVWHFLFLGWPDLDIPSTPEDQNALLELIKLSRSCVQDRREENGEDIKPKTVDDVTPPRVVHCSAGVGRTGTFIALDHLLHQFEDGKMDCLAAEADDCAYDKDDDAAYSDTEDVDPVFEAVKSLREQRMWLVGKPRQYAFIYQILRERWEAREAGEEVEAVINLSNGQVSQAKKRRLAEEELEDELNWDCKGTPLN